MVDYGTEHIGGVLTTEKFLVIVRAFDIGLTLLAAMH